MGKPAADKGWGKCLKGSWEGKPVGSKRVFQVANTRAGCSAMLCVCRGVSGSKRWRYRVMQGGGRGRETAATWVHGWHVCLGLETVAALLTKLNFIKIWCLDKAKTFCGDVSVSAVFMEMVFVVQSSLVISDQREIERESAKLKP